MNIDLSIIIPAYNESRYIKSCLSAITQQCNSNGINAEIIVVDNGSTDTTAAIAKQYSEKVFSINRSSVSCARNFGVKQSSYPVIAFIDGDVAITKKWTQCLIDNYQHFIAEPLFITGHQYMVPENASWIELYWFKNIKDQLLAGGNIITSKIAFAKIGGFEESLKTGEDYDYCIRSINAGIHYDTNVNFEAIHLGFPHTLKDFIKREYWHGEGDFKSIKHFLKSPVATLAIIYLTIQLVTITSLLLNKIDIFLSTITFLLLLNLLITYWRFRKFGIKIILICSVLNYAYFNARAFSLFRAIKNLNKKY